MAWDGRRGSYLAQSHTVARPERERKGDGMDKRKIEGLIDLLNDFAIWIDDADVTDEEVCAVNRVKELVESRIPEAEMDQ